MKGLTLLFLAIVVSIVGWNYCSRQSKMAAIKVVKDNLFAFLFAGLAVATAIFISTNSTLRLV